MEKFETIMPYHLSRKALIYVRQSSPNQQLTHQESLRLQYALKQKAFEFGWQENDIEMIDSDLGLSGKTTVQREGFKELLTKVTLGEVGIILSYEVTRLCRNCTDWYPLLDICGYRGCLIADTDGIYDPATINGRMILGLKGQISELELHTMRTRLIAGAENKAKRGELEQPLPAGYVRDAQGKVCKDPNLEIQHRIELVFSTFLRVKSACQVVRFFCQNNLTVPRYNKRRELIWKKPDVHVILFILKNPAYTGTFVRGRKLTCRDINDPSKTIRKHMPMEEWRIVIHDKYPKYITWETYLEIRQRLRDNKARYDEIHSARGVERDGLLMLQGIAYCGKCGHKMSVEYKRDNRYVCRYTLSSLAEFKACQIIPAVCVDREVIKAFFEAVSPIELNAYEKALEKQQGMEEKILQAQQEKIQRLEYQVDLARRQYDSVDPANRLVASELEKRWELALRELKQAKNEAHAKNLEQTTVANLSPEIKEAFTCIGPNLPEIWDSGILSNSSKKKLLRCLIDKVVLDRIKKDQAQIRIVWRGRATTTLCVPLNVASFNRLSFAEEMKKEVVKLFQEGKTDQDIAEQLTAQGYRSPRSSQVSKSTIKVIRRELHLSRRASRIFPPIPGYLDVKELSKFLDIPRHWFYRQLYAGKLKHTKTHKDNRHLFPDTPETFEKIRQLKKGEIDYLDFSGEESVLET